MYMSTLSCWCTLSPRAGMFQISFIQLIGGRYETYVIIDMGQSIQEWSK